MPARIYHDRDASLTPLLRRKATVIGFGSQGHAHALNLKNSGVKVTIGLYKGSKSIAVAKKHGFKVDPMEWWHFNYVSDTVFELLDIPFERLGF